MLYDLSRVSFWIKSASESQMANQDQSCFENLVRNSPDRARACWNTLEGVAPTSDHASVYLHCCSPVVFADTCILCSMATTIDESLGEKCRVHLCFCSPSSCCRLRIWKTFCIFAHKSIHCTLWDFCYDQQLATETPYPRQRYCNSHGRLMSALRYEMSQIIPNRQNGRQEAWCLHSKWTWVNKGDTHSTFMRDYPVIRLDAYSDC